MGCATLSEARKLTLLAHEVRRLPWLYVGESPWTASVSWFRARVAAKLSLVGAHEGCCCPFVAFLWLPCACGFPTRPSTNSTAMGMVLVGVDGHLLPLFGTSSHWERVGPSEVGGWLLVCITTLTHMVLPNGNGCCGRSKGITRKGSRPEEGMFLL